MFDKLVGALAGPVIGGIFDSMGASSANANSAKQAQAAMRFEKQQAEANRAFNWDAQIQNQQFNMSEATKARSFSQWMAETNYQRTTADLQKAGLNPMLAYTQGPSGVSSAAAASGSPVGAGGMASGKMGQVTSTVGSYARNAALSNIEATNAVLRAQARNIDVDSQLKMSTARKTEQETNNLKTSSTKMVAEITEILQRRETGKTQAGLNESYRELNGLKGKVLEVEKDLVEGRTSESLAHARLLAVIERLRRLDIPEAEAMAGYWRSKIGEWTPYGRAAGSIISSAAEALRSGRRPPKMIGRQRTETESKYGRHTQETYDYE